MLLVAATAAASFNQFPLSFFIFSFYRSVFIQSRFPLPLFRIRSQYARRIIRGSLESRYFIQILGSDPVIKYFTSDAANIHRVITFHASTLSISNEKEKKERKKKERINDVIDLDSRSSKGNETCISKTCISPYEFWIGESKLIEGERLRRASVIRDETFADEELGEL